MKIALKNLKSNPFRNFELYPIFPEWIDQLKDSIKQTGYWNSFCVRENNGEYQLAYGHHRLEALKQMMGEDYEIDIESEELSDSMMRARMFRENVRNEAQDSAVILHDIEVAKKFPSDWQGIRPDPSWSAIQKHKPTLAKIAIFIGREMATVRRVYYAQETDEKGGLTKEELRNIRPATAEAIATQIRHQKPSDEARKQIIKEAQEGNIGPKTAKNRIQEIVLDEKYPEPQLPAKPKEKPEIHVFIFKEAEPLANRLGKILKEINMASDSINYQNTNVISFAITLEELKKEIELFGEGFDNEIPKNQRKRHEING